MPPQVFLVNEVGCQSWMLSVDRPITAAAFQAFVQYMLHALYIHVVCYYSQMSAGNLLIMNQ